MHVERCPSSGASRTIIFCMPIAFLLLLLYAQPSYGQWVKTYSLDNTFIEAVTVQQTDDDGDGTKDDGYIVVGQIGFEKLLVLKLNNRGTISWQKIFETGDPLRWVLGETVLQTNDRGYLIVGRYPGGSVIVKLASNGVPQWQRSYPDISFTSDIKQTTAGNFFVAAGDLVKLSADGIPQSKRSFDGVQISQIQPVPSGGFVLAGRAGDFNNPAIWVARLRADDTIAWQKTYTHPYAAGEAISIAPTSDNGYIVTFPAGYNGPTWDDFWVIKLAPDGSVDWQKTYGGPNTDWPWGIH